MRCILYLQFVILFNSFINVDKNNKDKTLSGSVGIEPTIVYTKNKCPTIRLRCNLYLQYNIYKTIKMVVTVGIDHTTQ